MTPLQLLLTAVGLGIAYAGAPGAVNTESLRRGLALGWRAALGVQMGALLGDATWAVLGLRGVALLAQQRALLMGLGLVGGFFLLRLAWLAVQQAGQPVAPAPGGAPPARGDVLTGVVFGLANPFGLAFWSGMGSGMIAQGSTVGQLVIFVLAFFVGNLTWSLAMTALVGVGRPWLGRGAVRAVTVACGLALGYFGLRTLWAVAQESGLEALLLRARATP